MIQKEIAKERIKKLLFETQNCIVYSYTDKYKYGVIRVTRNKERKKFLSHRLSFEIYNNIILKSTDIICHKCDNPSCINPLHLFKGTHADNVKDKVLKNRQAKGKSNGNYKTGYFSKYDKKEKPKKEFDKLYNRLFTKIEVLEIKELIKNRNCTLKQLAIDYNISYSSIRDISSGRTYKDIIPAAPQY